MRKKYTVIALFEETGEVIADWQRASDAHTAMAQTATQRGDGHDLTIIGAIAGHKAITPPCEDSSKTASAVDLVPLPFLCSACGRPEGEL